jgi:hypothetical protein
MAGEPTINPYAPPTAEVDSPPTALTEGAFPRPLFSPRQMLAAAVVGSVLAGVMLLQANYRAMGRARVANRTLLLGTLACVALFVVFYFLPAHIPGTPVSIATGLVFYKLGDAMQGAAFLKHQAAGGARRSNWLVFGISVGMMAAIIVVLVVALLASGELDQLG